MGNTVQQWRASISSWTRGSMTPGTRCRGSSCCSPWFQLLVLMALLVIGGVELNPGPNQSDTLTFEKTGGFADAAGENYEWKMSALVFLRALQTGHQFQLASNMKAAGKFDDVVLTLRDCTVFLQLKHKKKSETVLKLRDLTRDKNFQLSKYLDSYMQIKQRWQEDADLQHCGSIKDAKFVIYTNARVDQNLVNTSGSADLLSIVNTGGTCVCLTELFDNLPKYKAALSAAVSCENVTATPELWEVVHKLYNKLAQALPSKKQLQEMLENLESLGDLTQYQQFIPYLYLCVGETAEEDLDCLIRHEIYSDTLLQKFLAEVQNWWKNSNCYLTGQSQFWQDIFNTCAANIVKPRPAIKVKFLEEHCNAIRQKLTCGNRMLFIHTQCTDLSCLKVLQSFKKYLLIDVSTLQTYLSEVLAVWRLGMCDVLVVEGETTDTNILNKLVSMSDSKCVVVISHEAQHIQLYQQFKFVLFTDTFSLSQLDSDSQTYILEHEVMFQGFPVKLNSLAEISFLQTAVTADVVLQLHHTLQLGQKLHDLDPCYLPRTFLRKEFVNENIFREHITLAVTGISDDRLAQLVTCGEEVQKDKTCKCFRIEGEAEFTALCDDNDNIHWIQAREGGFVWIKSKGDMSPVIKHLEKMNVPYVGADIVLMMPHHVVLVVAEPGMGKSTEMCNVAHTIKQKDPSTWVVGVDLNQHTKLLSQNLDDAVEFLEAVATLNTEFEKHLFEHQLQSDGNVVILVDGVDEVSPNYADQVIRLLKEFSVRKVRQIFVCSRPVLLSELQQNLSTLAFSVHQFTLDDQKTFLLRFWNQLFIKSCQLSHFISSLLQLVGISLNDNLKEFTGIPLQCKMLAEVYTDEATHFCQTGELRLPQTLDILELYDMFVDKKWEVYWKKINVDMDTAFSLVTYHKSMFQQSLMCCALVSYLHDDDVGNLHNSVIVLKQNQDFVSTFNVGQDKTGIVTHIASNKAVFVHRTFTEYFVAMWCSQNFDTESIIIQKMLFNQNFEIVQKFIDRILTKGLKLHTFVVNKNLAEVKNFLSAQNPDVNGKDKGGRAVLHLAIMNYFYRKDKINYSMVETLLEHGADVNCEDKVLHWSPLRLTEEVRAWSLVDKLLEKHADSKDLVWIRGNLKKQNPVQIARNQHFVQSDSFGDECEVSGSESKINVQYCMNESLEVVMYTALCEGYVNLVEFILKCGVSARYYSIPTYGYITTMLHIAAQHGQLRLVQFLIQQVTDVDVSGGWCDRTPLMEAAEHGHIEVVQLLISHGASVNTKDKYSNTALSLACSEGKNAIVKLLLQEGADVKITNGWHDRTPLMWAAVRGDVELADLLTTSGVSVNTGDLYGNTALSLATCERKNAIVKLLLQKGADIEISGGMYNRTPLMWAAAHGDMEVVQLLVTHTASVNTRDIYGDTALSLAARKGKHEIVKLLLQKRTDVEISDEWYNRTPLMWAAVRGHMEVVQLLITHGASVNTKDKYEDTALSSAARWGKNEAVKLLLKHTSFNTNDIAAVICHAGCGDMEVIQYLIENKMVNSQDKHGDTALLVATKLGNNQMVKLLLQEGADVEIPGEWYNRTPLMWAAVRGYVEVAQLLVSHGASVNTRDKYGHTSLSLAAREGKIEIVKLLLQKGADVEISDGLYTRTPLMCAVVRGYVEISGGVYNRTPLMWAAERGDVEVVQLLIAHGTSVNARDRVGSTALLLAVHKGNREIVKLLLQNGADVEISGEWYNRTPLMYAAERGDVKVVQLLISHGVSVNTRDKYGRTALLLAASEGNDHIVKFLLEKGSDVEISGGEYNTTPLMCAAENCHMEVVQLLITHGACVNKRGKFGDTALSLAASNDIQQLLLQHRAHE